MITRLAEYIVVEDASPNDGINSEEWANKLMAFLKHNSPPEREQERLDHEMDWRIDAGAYDPEREVIEP